MTILITNPDYDKTTSYTFTYARELIEFAKNNGINVTSFSKPKLTKDNITKFIKKMNPGLCIFNGHGDDLTIYGDKINDVEEPLIEQGINGDLLSNRMTYARTCSAASSLGKECIKNGGCFIGYSIPFQFAIDRKWSANPSKDKIARIFLEPSNLLAIALLKGNTAKDAVEKSNLESKQNIIRLLHKKDEPGSLLYIKLLWSNMLGIEILGDENMRYLAN